MINAKLCEKTKGKYSRDYYRVSSAAGPSSYAHSAIVGYVMITVLREKLLCRVNENRKIIILFSRFCDGKLINKPANDNSCVKHACIKF